MLALIAKEGSAISSPGCFSILALQLISQILWASVSTNEFLCGAEPLWSDSYPGWANFVLLCQGRVVGSYKENLFLILCFVRSFSHSVISVIASGKDGCIFDQFQWVLPSKEVSHQEYDMFVKIFIVSADNSDC